MCRWVYSDHERGPSATAATVSSRVGAAGWSGGSHWPVSDRGAYAGVAQDSVYVSDDARSQGVGRRLLEAVIRSADAADIWTIQNGIFPDNVVSIELHQRCGFRIIGVRERVGRLDGNWLDVVFMERRKA